MKVSSSKEKILKKIREALSNPVPLPFPKSEGSASIFPPASDDPEMMFAEEFTRLSGKFAFCMNEADLRAQLHNLIIQKEWKNLYCVEKKLIDLLTVPGFPPLNQSGLAETDAAITSCRALVARTGAIVMSSAQESGRTVSAYTPVHICIASIDQLVFDTKDALKDLKNQYGHDLPSMVTFAAGPSRTADIEKTLVQGVHGPKEVYVFLVDKPLQEKAI